jgi:hypothetical protein
MRALDGDELVIDMAKFDVIVLDAAARDSVPA